MKLGHPFALSEEVKSIYICARCGEEFKEGHNCQ